MKIERIARQGALAGVLLQAALALNAAAQGLPATPPLPPPRPAMPGDEQRAPPARDAPEPAPKHSEQTVPDARVNEANGMSPLDADRAILRACAIEWERMKESGAAGVKIWRDFAAACIERRSQF